MGREPGVTLSPSDERLLEYVRAGKVDAEIGARLGISVALVKMRIERLQQLSGAASRAALIEVDWAAVSLPDAKPPRREDSSPESATPEPAAPGRQGAGRAPLVLAVMLGAAVMAATAWTSQRTAPPPVDRPGQQEGTTGAPVVSPKDPATGWDDVPPHADERYRREQAHLADLRARCGWDPANDISFSADHAYACQESRAAASRNARPAGVSPVIPPAPAGH